MQRVTNGDWRRRLLRHHVPLALASAAVLVLFMNVSPFSDDHRHVDIFSGTFPQHRSADGTGAMNHGLHQTGGMGHGGGHGGPMRHGGDRTGRTRQGRLRTGPMEHGNDIGPMGEERNHMGDRSFIRRSTVPTGYIALGLLGLTLLTGPANLLLGRRNPVSSYLRRDMGAWTAIFSVVHVILGLQVHGSGRISQFLDYFVTRDGDPLLNSFGLANYTGLAALVIVVGLLAISSDAALRKLKARPWKRLQRLNYALFALVILHAFFYGALLRTTSPYTLLLGLTVIAVFVGQGLGIWAWRRRYSRSVAPLG